MFAGSDMLGDGGGWDRWGCPVDRPWKRAPDQAAGADRGHHYLEPGPGPLGTLSIEPSPMRPHGQAPGQK